MIKQTQLKWVRDNIDKNGSITRNYCLQNYVSRLSALIFKLNEEGYEFETKFEHFRTSHGWEGKDFVYTCTFNPNQTNSNQGVLF